MSAFEPVQAKGGGTPNVSTVTGVLPIANGGTGSATQPFVDLTTAQSIAGAKSFADIRLSGNGGAIQMLANNQYIGIANNVALPFRLLNLAATVEFMRAVSTTGSEYVHFATRTSLRRFVTARTADATLTADDSFKINTNEGAGGQVILTLPAAAAGLQCEFYVQAAQNIQVKAAGSNTIRIAASASSAGGTATNGTVGGTLILTAINATEWVAMTAPNGTWTLA